jgi:hypothetical protein
MLDKVLTVVLTALVYGAVVALLAGIVLLNLYAIVHAWRSARIGWAIVIAVLFMTGGWIATAVYLIVHHDEPLPASPRRHAVA